MTAGTLSCRNKNIWGERWLGGGKESWSCCAAGVSRVLSGTPACLIKPWTMRPLLLPVHLSTNWNPFALSQPQIPLCPSLASVHPRVCLVLISPHSHARTHISGENVFTYSTGLTHSCQHSFAIPAWLNSSVLQVQFNCFNTQAQCILTFLSNATNSKLPGHPVP